MTTWRQRHTANSTVPLPPAGPAEPLFLLVVEPSGSRRYRIPQSGVLTVGRRDGADVSLDHPWISREHAAIHSSAEGLHLEDLGSSNGTFIGEARLRPREIRPLAEGEVISLGPTILVVQRQPDQVLPGSPRPQARPPLAAALGEKMKPVYQVVDRVAPGAISVLLLGETGVGKELMAERIHRLSSRADRSLMKLNCGAFSETLLESELFGHERGAFTGAVNAKPGLLEVTQGGTVFLDEVGELSLGLQVKLLRVLEERQFRRVGGTRFVPLDVRFISATNRDLEEEARRQAFRQDLYFRLAGISIVIPPLRERRDEVDWLARLLLQDACRQGGRPPPALDPKALALLHSYSWPGNIRELRNVMERAALLCEGPVLLPRDLPLEKLRAALPEPSRQAAGPPGPVADVVPLPPALHSRVERLERESIVEALARHGWNQSRAAAELGISRNTLMSRMNAFGLVRPRRQGSKR